MTTEVVELKEGHFLFRSRGIGNNWLPCFICGHKPLSVCQADMASFVDHSLTVVSNIARDVNGKPLATHPVTDMMWTERFVATLDYRQSEPNRVQVKMGACGEHEPNLELLIYLTTTAGGSISAEMLHRCLPKRRLP